ncbi:hypothetical protein ACFOW4_12935 [Micromonospora sp. GCM10011542]
MEHSPGMRHRRTATGSAGTEGDLGRAKVSGDERVQRQGNS